MNADRLFWQVIRSARERRGLGVTEAARLLGIAQPTLSERESGRSGISEDVLIETARAYGLTLRELLLEGLSTEPSPASPPKRRRRLKKSRDPLARS